MPVTILNSQNHPINTRPLLQSARKALRSEGEAKAEVSIVLTDDETVHALNRDYRFQDKPTDVLSFSQRDQHPDAPLFDGPSGSSSELLGDVVISVETAIRQAHQNAVTLEEELSLLTVHGILHLLGYDDMTDEGAEEMQEKERALGVRK
jgi:probable rRNA maturation factor